MITIRNEMPADYAAVEALTREAFYNMYMPGCVEHYLVHVMRGHKDFVSELDFVLELDGTIIANVMYTRATLTDETGTVKEVLTLGPVCVAPTHQRQGYGRMIMEHSFEAARALGYEVVVLFGSPANYVARGFVSAHKHQVCAENGRYPAAMLVKLLEKDALAGHTWVYRDSPVMAIDEAKAAVYDATLPVMEKCWQPSQEEFYILSQTFFDQKA